MQSMTFSVSEKFAQAVYDNDPEYLIKLPMDGDEKFDLINFFTKLRDRTSRPLALVLYSLEEQERELTPLLGGSPQGEEQCDHAAETLDIIENRLVPEVRRRLGLGDDVAVILGGCSLIGMFALWAAHMTDSFYAVAAVSPALTVPNWKSFSDKYDLLTERIISTYSTRSRSKRL